METNNFIINEYFTRYNNLVKYIASKIAIRGDIIKKDDILQWGYMGLLKAIKTYNPNQNCNFTSYASKIIFRYIINKIIPYENNFIYIPKEYNTLKYKDYKGIELSKKQKQKLKNINRVVKYFEEENLENINCDVLNILENKINIDKIFKILSNMKKEEKKAIIHGLLAEYLGVKKMTHKELKEEFGITHISEINSKFSNKVRLLLK